MYLFIKQPVCDTDDSRQSTVDNRLTHFKTRAAKGLARVICAILYRSSLVSNHQNDMTSFSQLSIKYKNFENEPNPDPEPNPKPNPEPNPNQIEENRVEKSCLKI